MDAPGSCPGAEVLSSRDDVGRYRDASVISEINRAPKPFIAAVDGVDALFVGPADLAANLGHLGRADHADVQTAIARVLEIARKHGKAAGIFSTTAESARAAAVQGFTLIAVAADLTWLMRGASDALAAARGR